MYRKVTEQGTMRALLKKLGWIEHDTINLFEEQAGGNGNHEKRAALVCLMTAGFAASSSAVVVGSTAHGWFWLPPLKCWQPWAKAALENQLKKLPPAHDCVTRAEQIEQAPSLGPLSKLGADSRDAFVPDDFVELEPDLLGLSTLVLDCLLTCADAALDLGVRLS